MFTLWTLIEATMLCLNAICILHEERFLAKGMYCIVVLLTALFTVFRNLPIHNISVGWGANSQVHGFGEPPTTKTQMLNLFRSIRTVAKSK